MSFRRDSVFPVVTFHPATLLFAWGALVTFMQPLGPKGLAWIAILVLPIAVLFARRRTVLLIRRSRWLFLSIALLFVLATPGQRLPGVLGDIGVARDGILLAAEHILRLLLLLASLATLHERLGTTGMMAGMHWLLAPIAHWRTLRERIVVRLMLVLDHVEGAKAANWREWLNQDQHGPDHLTLVVGTARVVDWVTMALLGLLVFWVGTRG
ncbi:MAG: hypothetical protein KJ634_06600 [Gammaproteobacteria bacterium]|nr:hypothetical protein [Gammaproteobacteria bacterium]MBU1415275.1 hypothetical protein [Gammaproteobacteria bacterium]